jgi:hypothetical protein
MKNHINVMTSCCGNTNTKCGSTTKTIYGLPLVKAEQILKYEGIYQRKQPARKVLKYHTYESKKGKIFCNFRFNSSYYAKTEFKNCKISRSLQHHTGISR